MTNLAVLINISDATLTIPDDNVGNPTVQICLFLSIILTMHFDNSARFCKYYDNNNKTKHNSEKKATLRLKIGHFKTLILIGLDMIPHTVFFLIGRNKWTVNK